MTQEAEQGGEGGEGEEVSGAAGDEKKIRDPNYGAATTLDDAYREPINKCVSVLS